MAYMERPSTVRERMNQHSTPASSIIRIGIGNFPALEPSQFTSSAVAIGEPWEITKVAPRAMDIMARVEMNAGSLP